MQACMNMIHMHMFTYPANAIHFNDYKNTAVFEKCLISASTIDTQCCKLPKTKKFI